jgi:beta-galactosidase
LAIQKFLFGINDLAGLPKDPFIYTEKPLNTKESTLHILPHWNWEGREGQTLFFVYVYNSAELL